MALSFRFFFRFFCLALALAQVTIPAQAADKSAPENGWQTQIAAHPLTPSRLVAVDKNRQTLFVFERHSPLRLTDKYICTTGQAVGDKIVQGDLKTPEGIYFVVQRLGSGLDFKKYGNEAYTLNYPNPVDKLRKKTGYGIWIHGRGTSIVPRETQGCVAMNNSDIGVLGKNLLPGTAVTLAAEVTQVAELPAPDKATLAVLEKKTQGWAKAWGSRSSSLFEYYDPQAYSIAQGESFSSFRTQKERLFKSLPWIDTKIRDVHVLQGPGYWVTWFQQDYKAPNLSTKGVRRLYWQKDTKGDLRIVGMEWAPHLSGTLTASRGEAAFPPLDANPRSEEDFAPPKTEAPAKAVPEPAKPAVPPKADPPPAKTPPPATVATTPPPKEPETKAQRIEKLATEGAAFIESWRAVWLRGDIDKYMACYSSNAVQGSRKGKTAIESHKRVTWKNARPSKVQLSNVRISVDNGGIKADMVQEYADRSGFRDKGLKTLHLKRFGTTWRITSEEWSPAE